MYFAQPHSHSFLRDDTINNGQNVSSRVKYGPSIVYPRILLADVEIAKRVRVSLCQNYLLKYGCLRQNSDEPSLDNGRKFGEG